MTGFFQPFGPLLRFLRHHAAKKKGDMPMEITSFQDKTAIPSTEIMEKNEHLWNDRSRRGTVPRPIIAHRSVPCDTNRATGEIILIGLRTLVERASGLFRL